jgi:hypothetical protein
MLQYSRAAARCNCGTFAASEAWFLGMCRRRYLPELLLALVPMMNPASRAIPLSPLITQVQKQRERLLAFFSEAEIEEIATQHRDLVSACQK